MSMAGTLFLTIWRTARFLCLSSENSLNIFFSHRTSTSSAFEVITETRCINYLLTYLLDATYNKKNKSQKDSLQLTTNSKLTRNVAISKKADRTGYDRWYSCRTEPGQDE